MQPQLIAGGRAAFRHRLPFTLAFCFLLFVLTAPAAQTDFVTLDNQRVHPTRILAKLRAGASVQTQTRQAMFNQHALKIHRAPALVPRLMVLDEDDKHPGHAANAADPGGRAGRLRDRLAALRASGLFEYVEPDHVISLSATPTDTRFIDGTLWGLRNTGQSNGVPGADIGAVGAWDITTGSTNVIVAVLDTGIDYRHKDLTNNLWRNPGESGGGRETNGVDDDLDGYVDNVYGINAVTGSGDPADDNNHGSHVAGTIGASANDLGGHVGVAWNVRLMACKAFNQQGIGFGSDILRGIEFAIANGARIINASVGGPTFSQAAFDTIALARDRGVLLVAAAGNNGSLNNDTTPRYPSSYKLENIISVAALDRNDALPAFSHYGVQSVLLPSGLVLIFAGFDLTLWSMRGILPRQFDPCDTWGIPAAEVFDPGSERFGVTIDQVNRPVDLSAFGFPTCNLPEVDGSNGRSVVLTNGQVLQAGGYQLWDDPDESAYSSASYLFGRPEQED